MHVAKMLFFLGVNRDVLQDIFFKYRELVKLNVTVTVVMIVGQKCICPALLSDDPQRPTISKIAIFKQF